MTKYSLIFIVQLLSYICFSSLSCALENEVIRPNNWVEPNTNMDFVWVDSGCFEMGCDGKAYYCENDEKPVHKVCLDGFWISKYEVTQSTWERIMGGNPSRFKRGGKYPVENLTWYETQDFIAKLNALNLDTSNFRLPTEAEWEYACKSGGKEQIFSGGDNADSVMWHRKNSGVKTHAVGEKEPNGLGLYDMSGNVIEWCSDTYYPFGYIKHETKNPSFVEAHYSLKVMRGGNVWGKPRTGRCEKRRSSWPDIKEGGFRLVKEQ